MGKQNNEIPTIAVTKLEDPLKRKVDDLRDKADQYSDQAKERKQRDDLDKARENFRDKERKLVDGTPSHLIDSVS